MKDAEDENDEEERLFETPPNALDLADRTKQMAKGGNRDI